jgi:hypothetical protein
LGGASIGGTLPRTRSASAAPRLGELYGATEVDFVDGSWMNEVQTAPGGLELQYVQRLFTPRAWYNLVPDQAHTVVTAGRGNCNPGLGENAQDNDCATTARTADGTLVMTYLPTARTVTVNMTKLNGPATARFYDPTTGSFTTVSGSPFANSGSHGFTPPGGAHGDGYADWVLVLETNTPADTQPPTAPTNLHATAASSAEIDLSWTAATDNVGVGFYEV